MRSVALALAIAAAAVLAIPPAEALADRRAQARTQDAGAASPVPACILVTTDSRYIPYGYNHVVVLKNGCSKDADCVVSTDVNPQPIKATVPKDASVEVVTFVGSPSASFKARVACTLRATRRSIG